MRWLFRIAGVLIAAVAVAVIALLMLPGEKIAKIASDQVSARTGRDLDIEGGVSVTLWPVLGVETGAVTFANADWAGPEPMFRARAVAVGVDAASLLRGEIRVTRIEAEAPEIRLERKADGRANWQFGPLAASVSASETEPGDATSTPITLDRLTSRNATLTWIDADAQPITLDNVDLSLRWPGPTAPLNLNATLRPAGEPLLLSANIEDFTAFLDGAVAPLTAQMESPGGLITLVGRASTAGEAAGKLVVRTTDTARMLTALGLGNIDIPAGLGRAADISGKLALTGDGRLSLREMQMTLDRNRLSGAADVTLGLPMQITANLTAGALDLTSLRQPDKTSSTKSAGGPASSEWSKTPIDASALARMEGAISLAAQSVDLGQTQLGPTRLLLTTERARAVLKLVDVKAWKGTVTGQLVANNRNGLSVGGELRIADVELRDLLRDLSGYDRVSGPGTAQIQFLGVGQTMDTIMNSLRGSGAIKVGQGRIDGIDLDRLMRGGTEDTDGSTPFDSLEATYVIEAGNLQNDDLLMTLSRATVTGKGRVGLGARDLDYLFTPTAQREGGKSPLSLPVRIKGPWSDPQIRPELSEALEIRLDEARDAAEQRAKAAAQRKLSEELDTDISDEESVKDALRRKLEDKAALKLRQLLGTE